MTLRYAIIGSGMMGQEHIRNIHLLGDAAVCALADPDEGMRAASAALAPGAAVHADWRAMLAAESPDVFMVASPNDTHAEILEALVPLGKPILCEKPIVTDMAQARRVREIAAAATAPIWVAMEYRYMPGVSRLVADAHAGLAGPIHMMTVSERRYPFLHKVAAWNRFNARSGGTLVEKCCHFFDLMRLVIRSEPRRVYAVGGGRVNHVAERYDGRVPDILDSAYVTVSFENGVDAMLELCMFAEGARFQERIAVLGERASLEARVPGPGRFEPDGVHKPAEYAVARREGHPDGPPGETVAVEHVDAALLAAGDHHGSTFFQHRRFSAMARSGGAPEVSVEDGLRAVAIGLAAQTSIARGEAVDMAEFTV
jgi:predicted dehydrogenase